MKDIIGKVLLISGMRIQVVVETDTQYETRNITTGETILFDKQQLETAIKLGKAEQIET
jgi:hypothetical protein